MELVEFYKPRSLSRKRLDRYLAGGWFRSSNGLFRNRILCLDGKLCTVVNIRLHLQEHQWSKSQRRLLNKMDQYRVEIGPLKISRDMEQLYLKTKHRFKGFVFPDLHSFLYDFMDKKIFHSYQVRVYDGQQLIAASIFDCGEKGLMSVLGLYDADYKKISPGMLTMLLEMQWAKAKGFQYYYPGYVLHESESFNYKRQLGDFHFLNENHRWTKNYKSVVKSSPVPQLQAKSEQLAKALKQANIPFNQLYYKLFALGYAYPPGTFVRHPIIFILPELSDNPFKISIAGYDEESDSFRLSHPLPVQDEFLAQHQSKEFLDTNLYYDLVLQDSLEDQYPFFSVSELVEEIQRRLKKSSQHFFKPINLGKTIS